ncbi:MAG: hypothetical protein KatS3mg076_0601 [Candidatus Binatia bacterium]|nr:MAG: hypothetical protein KatS3mg076_0601 [Candidatus Binatia bacterium]
MATVRVGRKLAHPRARVKLPDGRSWALGVCLALTFSPAQAFFPRGEPALYRIEGRVVEPGSPGPLVVRVDTARGTRSWEIVAYRRLTAGDPWLLTDEVGVRRVDFVLRGTGPSVDALSQAPPGTAFAGTFLYVQDARVLLADGRTLVVGREKDG